MSDLARVVAFAFRRKGSEHIPGSDLRLLLAYDLRWFAPEDAKKVVARAIELGLLRESDKGLGPTFDVARVDIPVNFRPTTAVLDEDAPQSMPAPRAPDEGLERQADDERRRRGMLIAPEVARLIVERRAGADVTQRAAELEAKILKG